MVSLRLLLLGCTVAAAPFFAACSSVSPDETLTISCPSSDPATFTTVSLVVERRCGTLDCHGNPERPMRIYGQWALRQPIPPGDLDHVPGGEATTDGELRDNAASICGLEPAKIARVIAQQELPDTLTFVRKPRLQEKHKGGRIWDIASDGDRCVTSWILGAVDQAACDSEANSHL
jgi:hypothetical protein